LEQSTKHKVKKAAARTKRQGARTGKKRRASGLQKKKGGAAEGRNTTVDQCRAWVSGGPKPHLKVGWGDCGTTRSGKGKRLPLEKKKRQRRAKPKSGGKKEHAGSVG